MYNIVYSTLCYNMFSYKKPPTPKKINILQLLERDWKIERPQRPKYPSMGQAPKQDPTLPIMPHIMCDHYSKQGLHDRQRKPKKLVTQLSLNNE